MWVSMYFRTPFGTLPPPPPESIIHWWCFYVFDSGLSSSLLYSLQFTFPKQHIFSRYMFNETEDQHAVAKYVCFNVRNVRNVLVVRLSGSTGLAGVFAYWCLARWLRRFFSGNFYPCQRAFFPPHSLQYILTVVYIFMILLRKVYAKLSKEDTPPEFDNKFTWV